MPRACRRELDAPILSARKGTDFLQTLDTSALWSRKQGSKIRPKPVQGRIVQEGARPLGTVTPGRRYKIRMAWIWHVWINAMVFVPMARSKRIVVQSSDPPGNSHSKMGSTRSQFMEILCSPELLKNGVPHQPEIWIDFRATKKQTNKTAGFHFREDHGSAEMSILGQVANKCWIYSGDLWM